MTDPAVQYYRDQLQFHSSELAKIQQLDRRFSQLRLGLFLAGLAFLILGIAQFPWPALWYTATAAAAVAFILIAGRHEQISDERQRIQMLRDWHSEGLARLARDWDQLPSGDFGVPAEHIAVAHDLDLFGRGSLFQLIHQVGTERGTALLAGWLLEPAAPETVRARQAGVRELAGYQSFREQLALRNRKLRNSLASPRAFVDWSGEAPWYQERPKVRWLVVALTLICCVSGVLAVTTLAGWAIWCLLGTITVNLIACLTWVSGIHASFNRVSSRQGEVRQYVELFELVTQQRFEANRLVELSDVVQGTEHGVLSAMSRLARITSLASLRHAGLLSIIHVFLQVTLLWDFHVMWMLDRWKRQYGSSVMGWFDALGEIEAMASLALLGHDHPDWCYAEFAAEGNEITGRSVGHPLIGDDVRVCNDVLVGPPGTVLLVTGSNMSGKSTLLRAIGVNTVLAQAGGPVCAVSFRLPPVTVTTSMRVHDSLNDGVSFYMAELQRLKQIVDQAVDYEQRSDRRLLYLLDEILQGTNSKERHIAVCRVVAHLVQHQAIGAITTHDLELAGSPELTNAVHPVHFRETLHDDDSQPMTFDYQMRPGVATTTNALKLLALVGIK